MLKMKEGKRRVKGTGNFMTKAEGNELGEKQKNKKPGSQKYRLDQLLPGEKTVSFTENMIFAAQVTTGCGFASEVGLRN